AARYNPGIAMSVHRPYCQMLSVSQISHAGNPIPLMSQHPPKLSGQCNTLWLKTFHLYGMQTFKEDRQLKCCDPGCVTNLAKAEFCPDREIDQAKQVEVVDSALNRVPVRDCKVRNWVAEAATAAEIENTF